MLLVWSPGGKIFTNKMADKENFEVRFRVKNKNELTLYDFEPEP